MPKLKSPLLERRKFNSGNGLKIDLVGPTLPALHPEISAMYDVLEVLGQGAYAKVYRAIHRKDGGQVALKVVSCNHTSAIAKAEVSLLKRINHPNIVRALDLLVTEDQQAVMVLSFFDGCGLGTVVRRQQEKRLSEATAHMLIVQLVQALEHLDQHGIVHCDVKPQNVLVSRDCADLLLVDFNIASHASDFIDLVPQCSPAYASPEVLHGDPPSHVSDVWGAGLCLLTMVAGEHHECDDFMTNLPMVSILCRQTLRQCLATDPAMRPSATKLLQTQWLLCGLEDGQGEAMREDVFEPEYSSQDAFESESSRQLSDSAWSSQCMFESGCSSQDTCEALTASSEHNVASPCCKR